MKNFKELSWDVSEETYRQDKALHYSAISKFKNLGFEAVEHLEDSVDSASIAFGSLVDCMITGNNGDIDRKFYLGENVTPPSNVLCNILKCILEECSYTSLEEMPDTQIYTYLQRFEWGKRWKEATAVSKFKEECSEYFKHLVASKDKIFITQKDYEDALQVVDILKTSPVTKYYFNEDPFNDNIEIFYQLKFKININKVSYKCMPDLIVVIHDKKLIVPVDLKTTSFPEYSFYKSFVKWNYDQQARLYGRILREYMDSDDYFRNFNLATYKFVVISRYTKTPLVWSFKITDEMGGVTTGDITIGDTVFKDPFELGEELNEYIQTQAKYPRNIKLNEPNKIEDWLR